MLQHGRYADRMGGSTPVFMAAVLEYLTAETLELAGNASKEDKKMRITPRHIQLAVHNDEELSKLFRDVTIIGVGSLGAIGLWDHLLMTAVLGRGQSGDYRPQSEEGEQALEWWGISRLDLKMAMDGEVELHA
jgi:Core histone H2A/H2B/H3/H4